MAHTLILALGNPLRGDDGAGAAVLDALRGVDLPPGVELLDGGTAGLETVLLMQDRRRAIIIDAAEMGREPGAWARFTPDQVALAAGNMAEMGTLHMAGLAEALTLGAALGVLPAEIVIFGVQPQAIGWEPGLSDPVRAAVPVLVGAVLAELSGPLTG